jgi:hypothetical protein
MQTNRNLRTLTRTLIVAICLFVLVSVAVGLDAYAFWVVSKYPQFLIRWFGPSFMGLNFIKFLKLVTVVLAVTWLVSAYACIRVRREWVRGMDFNAESEVPVPAVSPSMVQPQAEAKSASLTELIEPSAAAVESQNAELAPSYARASGDGSQEGSQN